jgi:hypothetical protein
LSISIFFELPGAFEGPLSRGFVAEIDWVFLLRFEVAFFVDARSIGFAAIGESGSFTLSTLFFLADPTDGLANPRDSNLSR